jgi:acyl carrier protein
MNNLEIYKKVFCETLEINEEMLEDLKYQDTELWDSVGHMTLVSNIEEAFNIMLDADDIIDLSSFKSGWEILSTKYNIQC